MGYIITAVCLVAFYALAIWGMRYITKPSLVNALASTLIFSLYLYVVLHAYLSVGFYDWNFQNTLPTANVSPFMFSLMPLAWILPKKARGYFFLLISLLSFGMLCSSILSCAYNAARDYAFHLNFLADYVAHILLSLWGVYIVRSKQVVLTGRECVKSGALIVGVAFVMLILNLIFDTAFFGLSLTGKHNIYNVVLVKSSLLSAVLYISGLVAILFLGYAFNKILNDRTKKA